MQIGVFARIPAVLFLAAGAAVVQAQTPPPAFEVATIKLSPPMNPQAIMSGKMHIGMKIDAGRVDIGFMSMSDLICTAWKIKPFQLSGGDGPMGQRFDILAKMPDGATKEQVPDMLKALLAERFKLVVHRENKEHAIYALLVAKGGHKMKESVPDAPAPPIDADAPPAEAPASKAKPGEFTIAAGDSQIKVKPADGGGAMTMTSAENGKMTMKMGPDGMHMEAEKLSMAKLAESLSAFAGRPVVDMTELKGNFQVALDLTMQDLQAAARAAGVAMPGMPGAGGAAGGATPADAASDPSGGGSLFSNVQKLGLRLEPRKDQMEAIVIDHVEKNPTDN